MDLSQRSRNKLDAISTITPVMPTPPGSAVELLLNDESRYDQQKIQSPFKDIIEKYRPDMGPYEELYKHFHANPELSDQESETSAKIIEHLKKLSPDLKITSGVGGHGLFAVLENGPGKTILLRADIDGLPLPEKTGLPYASKKEARDADGNIRPVMHACGHDTHITTLLASAEALIAGREDWSGTIVFLFQPAEERGTGAKAMVDDGLYDPKKHNCPIPDLLLGQHVFPLRAGTVATKPGKLMTAADSFKITIHGSGGHGSMPHSCIDPVLIASHIVVKLQTIVAREVPPYETAVVTVGALNAGSTENVISDEAVLKLDIRSLTVEWREKILEAVKRIVKFECESGRCPKPPIFERTRDFPLTDNEQGLNTIVSSSFDEYFGDEHLGNLPNPAMGSEDFPNLAIPINKPYCFWFFGGAEQELYDQRQKAGKLNEMPINHSPYFAPAIQPTLKTGTDAMLVACLSALKASSRPQETRKERRIPLFE